MTDDEIREQCRLMCSQLSRDAMLRQGSPPDDLMVFVQAFIKREREACATIAINMGGPFIEADARGDGYCEARKDIAAAIRARAP